MIIAATGHRKPYEGFSEADKKIVNLKECLKKELERLKPKIEYCISGAAQGWDTWFAEACFDSGIPYVLYEPFKRHGAGWDEDSKTRHEILRENCRAEFLIQDEYTKDCFLKRDRAMVRNASHIIALRNPEAKRGGTVYTINYAIERNLPVYNMWQWMK